MSRPVAVAGSLPSPESIRAQLARILAHPAFAAHPRARAFLSFVVNEALAGRAGEIKQATIGCEVFGRPASYDPKQDAVVRSVARVVREKLNGYYLTEGAGDPVRIEIPKGTYVPSFRRCDAAAPAPATIASHAAAAACLAIAAAGYELVGHAKPVASAGRSAPATHGDAPALYRSGRDKLLSGDLTAARPLLESAAALAPHDALIHATLADDLSALGYDDACQAARNTLALLNGSGNQSASILVTALLSDAYGYGGRLAAARQTAAAARAMLSEHTAPVSRSAALAAAKVWRAGSPPQSTGLPQLQLQ